MLKTFCECQLLWKNLVKNVSNNTLSLLTPAPYVNYIQKDPGAPCSLTEALEYLQVDILENLMKKDSAQANQNLPPKNKPQNVTVVAMEGCHSFIILDWARPLAGDMVSGKRVKVSIGQTDVNLTDCWIFKNNF